jgi:hypothetical protein
LGKLIGTAYNTKTTFEVATASVEEKRPQANQAEKAERRLPILLADHRQEGTTFRDSMETLFSYGTRFPRIMKNHLVASQTEAMLNVFLDIPCFFSEVELELFL